MSERRSGILVHPSSLYSPFGIGDLGEGAYRFIDFLKKGKQTLWQILPLGHTGYGNSPYSAYSAFACSPMLISPEKLANDGLLGNEDLRNIPYFDKNRVEYDRVSEYKGKLFKRAFEMFKMYGDQAPFKEYCKENEFWLKDYALYIALKNNIMIRRKTESVLTDFITFVERAKNILKDTEIINMFYGAAFTSFPEKYLNLTPETRAQLEEELAEEIEYNCFLQYEFYKQWSALKKYANKNGIKIIGDMPIFVSSDSSDAWLHRELFHYDEKGFPTKVAGVPPDYFSSTGQLWGNPLYRWDYHKATGYDWWTKRIKQTLKYVDIVRIDHFRAFESYWEIPYPAETAVKGEWKKGPGRDFFNVMEKNLGGLPIIAEDLGDLNPEVHILRDELGLAGMKILQFAFSGAANDYLPHNNKNTNWVVYTGTHDNNTTIGWWNKDASETEKNYVKEYLKVDGTDIAWDFIRMAYCSIVDTVVIPLQDVLCLDEKARMNVPGVAGGNWEFRIEENSLSDGYANGLRLFSELYNRNNTDIPEYDNDGEDN
ncbi:MAG: 4-alpha-glucanotransferase [Clostridiales bacterium]|nr:4-alpha-glucanotransferase [Clostridiales bacterium]